MMKILIVDDDLTMSDFLRLFLTKKGYEVESAIDAESGLQKVKDFQPNIMFLDVNLEAGGLTGIDIIRDIKELSSDTHIIMMTAVNHPLYQEHAKELGAEDYVTKPFSLGDLENNVLPKVLAKLGQ